MKNFILSALTTKDHAQEAVINILTTLIVFFAYKFKQTFVYFNQLFLDKGLTITNTIIKLLIQ